ncbi:MAG TPA: MATE family efflux transporter [Nocardioidaceae bacterium]|nr:MATE family efflux transporter [Nocardioidaceae bacterium]
MTTRRPRPREDDREILRLAVPAFFALVAEPLFLLADTAIVGHLGTTPLAGLAIAATIVQTLVYLAVFLAYGTTAAVGRHLGAGDRRGALATGISGIWLALVIGVGLAVVVVAGADLIVRGFDADPAVNEAATDYLRIAALGMPPMLVVLAGTGILRGLQDTRTPLVIAVAANLANIGLNVWLVYGLDLGISGSALGTTLAQLGAGVALVVVVIRGARRHDAPLRPDRQGIAEAARSNVSLFVRTLTLRAALLLATLVASTMAASSIAAHQIVWTVTMALALALDAIAIAGQAMTGRYLGASDIASTRRTTRRMMEWGLWFGVIVGAVLLATSPWLPRAFSSDPDVWHAALGALIIVALTQPVSGVVFVLDGVLIGAGDGPYLARAGLVTLAVYAPLAGLVWVADLGLTWLWIAYAVLLAARAVTLVRRERSDDWLVTGVPVRSSS